MRKNNFLRVAAVVLFLLLVAGINVTYSYIIKKRDQNIIRIAFMNGSVQALSLDIERIQELKNNETLFKAAVITAADNYIKEVEQLNEQIMVANGGGREFYPMTTGTDPNRYRTIYNPSK